MARIKDESVERVKAATEILPLVEDYVRLRKAGGTYKGLCPVPPGADAELHRLARARHVQVLRLRRGRRRDHVRREARATSTSSARSRCSRSASASSSSTRRARPSRTRSGGASERLRQLLERADRVLRARAVGQRSRARSRASTSPRAGSARRSAASSGSATRPAAPTLTRRALQEGYTQEELLAVGLANRRGNDYFQRRIVFPLADARGARARLPGAQAPRRRPAAGEVRQLAGERALQEGRPPLRARHRAAGDREAGPRASSSRGTPTCSRCGRRGSSRSSRRWARR